MAKTNKKAKSAKKWNWRKFFAVIFMGITVALSFRVYKGEIQKKILWIIPWKDKAEFTMSPSLLTTLVAVLFYASVVIRRHKLILRDIYETVITVLNILFCASFIGLFISGEPWNIPLINLNSRTFLIIAIIFSWIGMSALAGFIWIFLFIVAIPRLATADILMGTYGVAYILCGFLSIGFQSTNIGETFNLLKNEYMGTASRIGQDVHSSIEMTRTVKARKPAAKRLPQKNIDD
jgi:hypothetical protein